jgi:hypothetical protein
MTIYAATSIHETPTIPPDSPDDTSPTKPRHKGPLTPFDDLFDWNAVDQWTPSEDMISQLILTNQATDRQEAIDNMRQYTRDTRFCPHCRKFIQTKSSLATGRARHVNKCARRGKKWEKYKEELMAAVAGLDDAKDKEGDKTAVEEGEQKIKLEES